MVEFLWQSGSLGMGKQCDSVDLAVWFSNCGSDSVNLIVCIIKCGSDNVELRRSGSNNVDLIVWF